MGRTFSTVPYTYLKRGVYYLLLTLLFGLNVGFIESSHARNWNKTSQAELKILFPVDGRTKYLPTPKKLLTFDAHTYLEAPKQLDLAISIRGSYDVDKDGHSEIFGFIAALRDNQQINLPLKPFVLEWDDDSEQLRISRIWKEALPALVYGIKAEFFTSSDGRTTDIFFADYGVDGKSPDPNCGAPNHWFRMQDGELLNKSANLPRFSDLTHDLVVIDLNQDKQADLVVINDRVPSQTNKSDCGDNTIVEDSYFLISSPQGFETVTFTDAGISNTHLYLTADVNMHGENAVLLLTRDGGRSNAGVDQYSLSISGNKVTVDSKKSFPLEGKGVSGDISSSKLIDGQKSMSLISHALSNDWKGNQLTAVVSDNGVTEIKYAHFSDEYQKVMGPNDRGWCEKIYFLDLDDNGVPDYTCANRTKGQFEKRASVVLNDIDGKSWNLELARDEFRQKTPLKLDDKTLIVANIFKGNLAAGTWRYEFYGYDMSGLSDKKPSDFWQPFVSGSVQPIEERRSQACSDPKFAEMMGGACD